MKKLFLMTITLGLLSGVASMFIEDYLEKESLKLEDWVEVPNFGGHFHFQLSDLGSPIALNTLEAQYLDSKIKQEVPFNHFQEVAYALSDKMGDGQSHRFYMAVIEADKATYLYMLGRKLAVKTVWELPKPGVLSKIFFVHYEIRDVQYKKEGWNYYYVKRSYHISGLENPYRGFLIWSITMVIFLIFECFSPKPD